MFRWTGWAEETGKQAEAELNKGQMSRSFDLLGPAYFYTRYS